MSDDETKGKLIVISAPSGCGKTTIVKRLLEQNRNLTRSISYTTRRPRRGEENGRDYFFISKDEFSSKQRRGFFIESADVFGHSYGTSREAVLGEVAKGRRVILAIDVQGMKQLRTKTQGEIPITTFFIMPPSVETLRARLQRRKTDTAEEIGRRLQMAQDEMAERSGYDFVVVNHHVDQAVKEIEAIVKE